MDSDAVDFAKLASPYARQRLEWARKLSPDADFSENLLGSGQILAFDGGEELVMPAVLWALAGVCLADSAARAARRMARLEALRRVMGIEPFTAETAETAEHHADIMRSPAAA